MRRPSPTALATSAAVTATALVGTAGTDVTSRWYRGLEKPPWQPPGPVFGIAWSGLYVLLATAGARALAAAGPRERRSHGRAYAANLVLNAGWTRAFFRLRRPPIAAAEAVVLAASTADLARRSARLDPTAGRLLLPYAAWTAFAAALSAEIARRNRG
ncbi:tryptophan-rich sensory protein [Geodermatophilus bullaregiensis]|uniref:TspO/MBR family protein n=1 Tax=Geodermatophilus bullaregiensis TaxID=1564160 RepID=UPI001957ED1C|nr:TspO/MBR family protein [Geodermatophilus bullaregiensis]MBM7805121.1 tryptophan-rich sensory protein [Geodermatophilus bullaregiensis]